MTNIMRWDPFREMEGLRRSVDRMFDDWFRRPAFTLWEGDLSLPLDVYETDDALVVKAALPGVKPEEVELSVTGETLTIKGEAKHREEVKQENYHRQELRYGAFTRSITLPTRVEHEKAEAVFDNGVLTITMPKAEEVKSKAIPIKTVVQQK